MLTPCCRYTALLLLLVASLCQASLEQAVESPITINGIRCHYGSCATLDEAVGSPITISLVTVARRFYYYTVLVANISSPCGDRPTKKDFAQRVIWSLAASVSTSWGQSHKRGRTSVFWRQGKYSSSDCLSFSLAGWLSGHPCTSRGDPRTVRNGWSPSFNSLAGGHTADCMAFAVHPCLFP